MPRLHLDLEEDCAAGAQRRLPTNTGERNGGCAEGNERKDENARVRGQEDEARCTGERKSEDVNDEINEEGDNEMEEAREKRKRDESVDDDVMKEGKEQLEWTGECGGDDEGFEEIGRGERKGDQDHGRYKDMCPLHSE